MMKKILIIDDDKEDIDLMAKAIFRQDNSCDMLEAKSGVEGLDKLKENSPDGVVLDTGLLFKKGVVQ